MGRTTKLFKRLTQPVSDDRLNTPEKREPVDIVETLLSQLEKSRNSARKAQYRERILNCVKNLSMIRHYHAVSRIESRKEDQRLEDALARQRENYENLERKYLTLDDKLHTSKNFERLLEEQKKQTRNSQSHYSELLRENEALENKMDTLKARVKSEETLELQRQIRNLKRQVNRLKNKHDS